MLPVHDLKIKYLVHYQGDLTSWERKFIRNIQKRAFLTPKQAEKLDEVYEGLRGGRQFHFGDIVETWEDVHNFDR